MSETLGPFALGRVHLGDCHDLLRRVPLGAVDAVLADPPYSSGGTFRSDRQRSTREKYVQAGQRTSPDFSGDNRDQRGFAAFSLAWMNRAWHVTRDGGALMVFTDWRQLPTVTDAMQAANWVWRGINVWDKTQGVRPQLGRFRAQAEFIVWGTKGPAALGTARTAPGVWKCVSSATSSDHQTAKPEPVMDWLLSLLPAGALVLDPFAGGGATGVACQSRGMRFLGFELDPYWCAYANRRLGVTPSEAGTPLFGAGA